METATAKDKSFASVVCLPLGNTAPARSILSASSVQAARSARELQRLEEERQLQEEGLRRKAEYIARKYELLKQQNALLAQSKKLNVRGYRTNRTASDRAEVWIKKEEATNITGPSARDAKAITYGPPSTAIADPVEQRVTNCTFISPSDEKSATQATVFVTTTKQGLEKHFNDLPLVKLSARDKGGVPYASRQNSESRFNGEPANLEQFSEAHAVCIDGHTGNNPTGTERNGSQISINSPKTLEEVLLPSAGLWSTLFPSRVGTREREFIPDIPPSFPPLLPPPDPMNMASGNSRAVCSHPEFALDQVTARQVSSKSLTNLGDCNKRSIHNNVNMHPTEARRNLVMRNQLRLQKFSIPFNFRVQEQELISNEDITMKHLLRSAVMVLYPQGLPASFVVHEKIIQNVWCANADWNKLIPREISHQWQLWPAVLQEMSSFEIPRYSFPYYYQDNLKSVELYTFVEPNEQANAAVEYSRILDLSCRVPYLLMTAKTAGTPLQRISIPRLESLVTVIEVMMQVVVVIFENNSLRFKKVYLGSDSSNALSLIELSDLYKYQLYISSKYNEILTRFESNEWTGRKAAEEATKWSKSLSLGSCSKWCRSSEFLYDHKEDWLKNLKKELNGIAIPRHELLTGVLRTRLQSTTCMNHLLRFDKKNVRNDSSNSTYWIRAGNMRRYLTPYTRNARKKNWVFSWSNEFTKRGKGPAVDSTGKWYQCSDCLYKDDNNWPKEHTEAEYDASELLQRAGIFNHFFKQPSTKFAQFVSWVMCTHRSIENCERRRDIKPKKKKWVNRAKIQRAKQRSWFLTQSVAYSNEVAVLSRRMKLFPEACKSLIKWTSLRERFTALDELGDLCVQNLIDATKCARLSYENNETVVNNIRRKCDPSELSVIMTTFSRSCIRCQVCTAESRMDSSPRAKLTPFVRLFSITSIAHVGSYLKKLRRSAWKWWMAFLTYPMFHAMLLEFEAVLSMDSCRNDIHRFLDYMGRPLAFESKIVHMVQELTSTFTNAMKPYLGGCNGRMFSCIETALKILLAGSELNHKSFVTQLVDTKITVKFLSSTFVSLKNAVQGTLNSNRFLFMRLSGVVQPVTTHIADDGAIARLKKWFDEVEPVEGEKIVVTVHEGVQNQCLRGQVVMISSAKDELILQGDVLIADCKEGWKSLMKIAAREVAVVGDAGAKSQATRGGVCCDSFPYLNFNTLRAAHAKLG